uniref:Egress of capsids from nucleus n=1 Tax=Otarine gammaherpesvirus 4 TaxID=2801541 RepID=A0A889IYD5_9GAMA|nr:Egress of capsids from nucleus [Otarine gammaherpesvirus 4]
MVGAQTLVNELCYIVRAFLGQSGVAIDFEQGPLGPHVFTKGDSQAICTVKLQHGQLYNIEFVYRFWAHRLSTYHYPFFPCFIINNNGLATTLKCFLSEPRDVHACFGMFLPMALDVNLTKNASILLRQDDFIKFKTPLVFTKDLSILNSMVVCRAHLSDNRHALQFLVVRPRSQHRVSSLLDAIANAAGVAGYLMRSPCNTPPHIGKHGLVESSRGSQIMGDNKHALQSSNVLANGVQYNWATNSQLVMPGVVGMFYTIPKLIKTVAVQAMKQTRWVMSTTGPIVALALVVTAVGVAAGWINMI